MSTNAALFERAQRTIPGGVNSPVRAFRAVGGTPASSASARRLHLGCRRPAIHRPHRLLGPDDRRPRPPRGAQEAVQKAVVDGFSFGAPTEREVELAEILKLVPSAEQVRLVSSVPKPA